MGAILKLLERVRVPSTGWKSTAVSLFSSWVNQRQLDLFRHPTNQAVALNDG